MPPGLRRLPHQGSQHSALPASHESALWTLQRAETSTSWHPEVTLTWNCGTTDDGEGRDLVDISDQNMPFPKKSECPADPWWSPSGGMRNSWAVSYQTIPLPRACLGHGPNSCFVFFFNKVNEIGWWGGVGNTLYLHIFLIKFWEREWLNFISKQGH